MCLILLAWQVPGRQPLVVAANRDEFHGRPSAPAAFWEDQPAILAGRDLEATRHLDGHRARRQVRRGDQLSRWNRAVVRRSRAGFSGYGFSVR